MQYETDLPAIHLHDELIAALEDVICSRCTNPDPSYELDHRRVTYEYDSAAEIVDDFALPPVVWSFEIAVSAEEGHLELISNSWDGDLTLRVHGQQEWVETQRDGIREFVDQHSSTVRTLLERYLALGLTTACVAFGLLTYYSGFGSLIGMRAAVDALLYGSVAAIVGGFLHIVLGAIYPYAVIVAAEGERRLPVYLSWGR